MSMAATEPKLPVSNISSIQFDGVKEKCFAALNDDLNSPIAIAHLFDGVKMINSIDAGTQTINAEDLNALKSFYKTMVFGILGLKEEDSTDSADNEVLSGTVELLIQLRRDAKANKDWGTADKIRDELNSIGIELKDTKEGVDWNLKKK